MYNPHIVARQLGYDQDVPFPIVHGFKSKGIKVWVPGTCRRGIASKEYVAWLNGQFVSRQEADQFVRSQKENCARSFPLNSCDMDCSATVVKRKNGKKRRDTLSENGDMNKKIKVSGNECHLQVYDDGPSVASCTEKKSLQFDGKKYFGLQKDPNSCINNHDEQTELESDDECIVIKLCDKKCEVINLDDDEESICDPEDNDRQLVLELEEFVRCGLFSQWEESSDEDEGGGGKQPTPKNSNIDPYAKAAMREYPLFFELIPQRPHYRGLANKDDSLRDLVCSGMWLLLVGLAREVLKTSCDTDASEVAYLMKKAKRLEQNGFSVNHLIARLKEPQTRLRKLQDSRERLEDARTKEQESKGVKSLSSHLSNLKHNILTMERDLDEKKQACGASVHNELSEGIDLVSLEKKVEAAEKNCQAMKDEVAAMRLKYTDL
uniref:Uncharacterized protein n=1 Tax=Avena sativa TaxID=4498 RepID=A0ACD5V062_AVESA